MPKPHPMRAPSLPSDIKYRTTSSHVDRSMLKFDQFASAHSIRAIPTNMPALQAWLPAGKLAAGSTKNQTAANVSSKHALLCRLHLKAMCRTPYYSNHSPNPHNNANGRQNSMLQGLVAKPLVASKSLFQTNPRYLHRLQHSVSI